MQSPQKTIALIQDDPWLKPYTVDVQDRIDRFELALKEIKTHAGSLRQFADHYKYLGFHWDEQAKGWWYREWAPAAHALFLTGDFNEWNRQSHPLSKFENGVWEIFLPYDAYQNKIVHGGKVKVAIQSELGLLDRIPAYMQRVVQDPLDHSFAGQLWFPEKPYKWNDSRFKREAQQNPLIYECHIGMSQEKEGLGSYKEFRENTLPRIHQLGYNVIQFMAIAEHPYYGSFGYHVSNYFAPSSRFGTPEELKELIDAAHRLGIAIVMDIVHSHSIKNMGEGLNKFDGSGSQYFHEGSRGEHTLWDSLLFNYGKWEVKQFLLSNLSYWLQEFHFDGFRFDGVTSMLYFHHGDITFDHYDYYFKEGVDWDAIIYLQLANTLIHEIKSENLSIAEDMSGMPGGCRLIGDGGLGFDYRLGMGIPDYWIKLLKHQKDEEWDLQQLWQTLCNRRYKEKTIAYCESHDQALVGDKTIAFWLMDKEMYWHMQEHDADLTIERGLALHKMIRFITLLLGGEAYMNFIGNEFGHPEWIDFPREGNGWSYKYARRQWSLVDNLTLKYKFFSAFDKSMIHFAKSSNILASDGAQQLNMDFENKILVGERNNYIFIFNFHPDRSIFDYRFPIKESGVYKIVLNTDDAAFGGHGRIHNEVDYISQTKEGQPVLSLYITQRTGLVLKRNS